MSQKHRAVAGSIHRIREFELEKVCLAEEFDILQIVGEGWFGKILLVEHRGTDTEMVLKALPKPYVALRDFYREFHYGLHLAQHKNIITTYDVAFETAGFYVFSQEYAPLGDLTSNVSETGIGELHTKRVARQLGAALEHLHNRELVHRDVKLDNILIFKSDFSRIKLCDFGETRKVNTEITRRHEWLPYCPPELLRVPIDHTYKAATMHDVWQFGIVVFVCLTGCLPWQKAAIDDPRYVRYLNWYNSSNPLKKQPKLFKLVSSKAQRLFKKFLEPRPEKRTTSLGDLSKFLDDRWMAKGINDKNGNDGLDLDELCPSMYSFHSDLDEKNKLLNVLLQHGMETTVDRVAKKARIKDWIQKSIIMEEDENEIEEEFEKNLSDEDEETYNDYMHPIEKNHQRWSSMRYATEKHINPRTGEVFNKQNNQSYNNEMNDSYDMKNIEPLLASNSRTQTNKKDESPTHSSIKDSAYGSIDFKSNTKQPSGQPEKDTYSKPTVSVVSYPSEQLQKDIQQGTFDAKFNNNNAKNSSYDKLPQNKKLGTNSIETNVSVISINSLENGSDNYKDGNNFSSMKDNAYDNVRNNNAQSVNAPLSLVHGHMRINPYSQSPLGNFRKPLNNEQNLSQNKASSLTSSGFLKNDDLLDEDEKQSIVQIKKMLVKNGTGIKND